MIRRWGRSAIKLVQKEIHRKHGGEEAHTRRRK